MTFRKFDYDVEGALAWLIDEPGKNNHENFDQTTKIHIYINNAVDAVKEIMEQESPPSIGM